MEKKLVIFLCFLAVGVDAATSRKFPKQFDKILDCFLIDFKEDCSTKGYGWKEYMKSAKAIEILKNTKTKRSNNDALFKSVVEQIMPKFSTKATADGVEDCPLDPYTNGPVAMARVRECMDGILDTEDDYSRALRKDVLDAIAHELETLNTRCIDNLMAKKDKDREDIAGWSLSMKDVLTSMKYCSQPKKLDCFRFHARFGGGRKDTKLPYWAPRSLFDQADEFYDYAMRHCLPSSWNIEHTRHGLRSCSNTTNEIHLEKCLSEAQTTTNTMNPEINTYILEEWDYRQKICNNDTSVVLEKGSSLHGNDKCKY